MVKDPPVAMPVHHAIWRIGDPPSQLPPGRLPSEQMLETMIVQQPAILSGEWMIIGRQEITTHGGRIDLLAIAPDASLVLIELKRDRTSRDIVAQALDYASWVDTLTPDRTAQIYQRYSNGKSLDSAFRARFGVELDEDAMNQSHQIIIVASELDPSTERIVGYLNARDIAINVVFFQVFQSGDEQLLSRAWLIDPGETQANAAAATPSTPRDREPWNGEFYVSFGDATSRSWEDARRFGFISAGGGTWYTQTLKLLSPGDRIWVRIPGRGYVGVGLVEQPAQPVGSFNVMTHDGEQPALDVLEHADRYRATAGDPEQAEQVVRVRWLHTLPEREAIREVGLFGNQNTVCQPTTPKWRHTVERLKQVFPRWQDDPTDLG